MGYVCIPLTLLPIKIFKTDYILDENTENENEEIYEDSLKNLMKQDILPPNVPNEDLPFRCDDDVPRLIERPYNFLNAPVIKFINHSVCKSCIMYIKKTTKLKFTLTLFKVYHIMFVLLFAYCMLFSFFPAYTKIKGANELRFEMDIGYFRVTYIEMAVIFWNLTFFIEVMRQVTY